MVRVKPAFILLFGLVLDQEILILNICILFRFQDHENMLEDTWNMDFGGGGNMGLPMWDSFAFSPSKPKKEEKIGLAEAITSSILSAGICCDALSYFI